MTSKKRTKKKRQSARKPKADAVTSKRRPPRPLPHRPSPASVAAVPESPPEPIEPVSPEASSPEPSSTEEGETESPSEDITFTGEDPAAWGWLNVWPFLDEADEDQDDAAPAAVPVDQEPPPEPEPEPEPEPTLPEPVVPVDVPDPTTTHFRGWPDEPPVSSGSRRRRAVGIAALLTAAVVVVGALAWLATGRGGDERVRPVHSDAYAAPVHLAPATSYVRSRVLPSGEIQVTHWIRPRSAVDSLTVRTPRTLGLAPGAVTISHVVLATDGTPYPTASMAKGHPRTETFRFPVASTLYLRYRLSGVLQASGPDGRALARITSLDVSTGGEALRTVRTVLGARVLAMACTTGPPDATPAPCGTTDGTAWTVRLGRADHSSRVMAQLDLS